MVDEDRLQLVVDAAKDFRPVSAASGGKKSPSWHDLQGTAGGWGSISSMPLSILHRVRMASCKAAQVSAQACQEQHPEASSHFRSRGAAGNALHRPPDAPSTGTGAPTTFPIRHRVGQPAPVELL